MDLLVFRSARARRRAAWAGSLAGAAALGVAAVLLLPSHGPKQPLLHLRGPGQVVREPPAVPLTSARRRAIDELLDAFVPAAVERRSPLRALPLVTPEFRSGVSRASWAQGNLPVFPYQAKGEAFHGWTLDYSHPDEISVDVLLHPAPRETLGPIAFTAVFKQRGGRWLIDSFVPAASFAGPRKPPRILAQPDFQPNPSGRGDARLSSHWLLLPLALLALVVLVPAGIGFVHWRRGRRAWKRYHRAFSSR